MDSRSLSAISKTLIFILVMGWILVEGALPSPAAEGKYYALRMGEKDQEILEVVDDLDRVFDRRGYVLHDKEATARLQEVCGSVLEDEPIQEHMDFTFRIIREPLPNAFAMPNGSVYFTTGMLGALEDEAQLAAICAHEANHVLGHHTFLSMQSQRRKTAGAIAGSMILGAATAQVGGVGGALLQQATGIGLQILYISSVLGYSRDLEEEADRRAVQMVVDAGYDPSAMVEVFEILDQDYEGLALETKTFWLSHPKLEDRIEYTRAILAEEYPDLSERGDLRRGREEYLEVTADVARHNVKLLLASEYPRTALAMAEYLVEDHGPTGEHLVLLGDAWRKLGGLTPDPPAEETTKKAIKQRRKDLYRRTPQERARARLSTEAGQTAWQRNARESERAYREALETDPQAHEAWRGLGLLYEEQGRYQEAVEALAVYLAASPQARDRYVVQRHLIKARARAQERQRLEQRGGEGGPDEEIRGELSTDGDES